MVTASGDLQAGYAIGSAAMVGLDRNGGEPLWSQLEAGLRAAILGGRLPAGSRLPSSRALAKTLGIARNTVGVAYAELVAQGYLEAAVGSGTFVSDQIPDRSLRSGRRGAAIEARSDEPFAPSARGQLLGRWPVSHAREDPPAEPLRPGIPAFAEFPHRTWRRALRYAESSLDAATRMGHHSPAGYFPLRQAIADHLASTRALQVGADQVIVVPGAQFALSLLAQILADPSDLALVEDPCRGGVYAALAGAGLQIEPAPVDQEGFPINLLSPRRPPRIIYLTSSHQFPLAGATSLRRRLGLLEFARDSRSWIVEDDYDGELKFSGRPLPSLQGLDRGSRVVYIGTFARTMFPALRIGYIVAPKSAVEAMVTARSAWDRFDAVERQAALAWFIREGHLDRHLRRMRTLYAARQHAFLAALAPASDLIHVRPAQAGLHVVLHLPPGVDDQDMQLRLARRRVEVVALSRFVAGPRRPSALVAGYAGFSTDQLRSAAATLIREVASAV